MIPPAKAVSFILFNVALACSACAAEPVGNPEWASKVTWYQIFPERFRNGDPSNDPMRDSLELPVKAGTNWRISSWTADWYSRDQWEKDLGKDFYEDGVFMRRYGGDLQGVIDSLDYLQDLGITAIYFNPVFHARSLHKYDGSYFHHVDPYFGPDPAGDLALEASETGDPSSWHWTAADKLFLSLVEKAHARGMRVIIDGVFNHSGRDFFAFRDLLKNQQNSPYKDWYLVTQWDDPKTPADEFDYKGWWGHKSLPLFSWSADGKTMHDGPKHYIFAATRRWLDPNGDGNPADGVDGWRLDVADERPAAFWSEWNGLVHSIRPDAYTTAETWKDAPSFLKAGGFSAAMNYHAFAIPVKGYLIDEHLTATQFIEMLNTRRTAFPDSTAYVLQNLIDSHDTDRVASMVVNPRCAPYPEDGSIPFSANNSTRANASYQIRKPNAEERAVQKLIALLQCTYVGAPMFYYGTESGMWGANDPDCRMPMVWRGIKYAPQTIDPRGTVRQPDDVNFDEELFTTYRSLIHLRNEQPVLQQGKIEFLKRDDGASVVAFLRFDDKSRLLVILNRDSKAGHSVTLPAAAATQLVATGVGSNPEVRVESAGGNVTATLPPLTGAVLKLE